MDSIANLTCDVLMSNLIERGGLWIRANWCGLLLITFRDQCCRFAFMTALFPFGAAASYQKMNSSSAIQ